MLSSSDVADGAAPGTHVVLILCSDTVAAALIGAFVETLGYLVRFYHPPETPESAVRRTRPAVMLVDCEDPSVMNLELLGRARMRGISAVVFGTTNALERVGELVEEHDLDTLIMPASLDQLDDSLRQAIASC